MPSTAPHAINSMAPAMKLAQIFSLLSGINPVRICSFPCSIPIVRSIPDIGRIRLQPRMSESCLALVTETPTSITFRQAEGIEESMLRVNLQSLRSTTLSLMPEGLEKELKPQDVADLFAYLRTARK